MESIRIFSKVAGSIWIEEANDVEQDGQVKLGADVLRRGWLTTPSGSGQQLGSRW